MNEVVLYGDSHILVRNMGYTHTNKNWVHPDRNLDYNVFIFVLQGCMQVCEDHTEYILHPGDAFFLKSGLHHWGDPKTLENTITFWIHFYDSPYSSAQRSEIPAYSHGLLYQKKNYEYKMTLPKLLPIKNTQFMAYKLKALYDQYLQQDSMGLQSISLLAMDLFIHIYRQSKEKQHFTKSEVITQKLVAYLQEHSDSDITSQEISSLFQLNYNYLSTLFKEVVGMSISEYHKQVRMQKAAALLKSTSMNISEVSQAVGYSDPLYFSKVFRSVMGESPSQYLKSFYL